MKNKYIIPTVKVIHVAYNAIMLQSLYSVNRYQENDKTIVGDTGEK